MDWMPEISRLQDLHGPRQMLLGSETDLARKILSFCRRRCSADHREELQQAKFGSKGSKAPGLKKDASELRAALLKGDFEAHRLALSSWEDAAPLIEAWRAVQAQRKIPEKPMTQIVESLPIWEGWGKDFAGLGALGLAQIIAEAGDIGRFATDAKLGVWMSVRSKVIDGQVHVQRKVRGNPGLAQRLSFVPDRALVMHNAASGQLKAADRPLRWIYDEARRKYASRQMCAACGLVNSDPAPPETKKDVWKKCPNCKPSRKPALADIFALPEVAEEALRGSKLVDVLDQSQSLGPTRVHLRAMRPVKQALLSCIWSAWRLLMMEEWPAKWAAARVEEIVDRYGLAGLDRVCDLSGLSSRDVGEAIRPRVTPPLHQVPALVGALQEVA